MQSHQSAQSASDHPDVVDGVAIAQRADLFASYLSPSELFEVRQRMLDHAGDWTVLIGQATQQMSAGAAPHDAAVQDLALRWAALFRATYAGDDAALDGKVRSAFAREPGLSANIDMGLTVFMQRALMHLHRPPANQDAIRDDSPKPSARMTATLRAAHQLLDIPRILDDPLALTILGPTQEAEMRADPGRYSNPVSNVMRATMAVRSRLAEDSWLQAQREGVRQYVILGAGLDTFAYRTGAHPDADLFEVDLPAMQRWKRACLRTAGIAEPARLRYVAIDFAETTLEQGLLASGLNADLPVTFCWLGVSMYLTTQVVLHTLRYIASCAPGSGIVFDYLMQPERLTLSERTGLEMMAAGLAAQGEPLQSYFDPEIFEHLLRQFGFRQIAHFSPQSLSERYLTGRSDGLRLSDVFRMIRATV
ncbi:SAM-dependent methyltransferase [Massilia sp. S19_KUP03_FR1]|uniref:SAM-dependent methyltransferase n=1 Tax=Massilia sp. S19_KUP03_FR1 TaxID=3025503 RepID=UPI002FCDC660